MTRTALRTAFACWIVLAANVDASAFSDGVNRCRSAVVKDTTRHVAKLVALQAGCHDARVQGKIPAVTDCNDLPAAAAALEKVLPLQALAQDPGAPGGKCETLTPAEAFYTSCPVPCDSTVVTDWASVNQCLTCLATERIEEFGISALGSAILPIAEEEELCARSLYSVAARVLPSLLRDSEKCGRKLKDPNVCADLYPGRTLKVRRRTSTRVSANCKGVDFAAVGACATALGDAACLLTAARNTGDQLAYDAARLQERVLPLSMSPFASVSVGNQMACGLRLDGTLDCWSRDGGIGQFGRRGRFVNVSSGSQGTCGIRPDGSLDCFWNLQFTPKTDYSPPAGEFSDVAVGSSHACALDSLGAATCWGTNLFGQADAPGGIFVEISAGDDHTCGRRGDGTVECWGSNLHGQASPPPGVFTEVSAGHFLTCGLRNDGSAECWGNNDFGMATVPPGPFLKLADRVSYNYYSCGIRPDSTVECWGEEGLGDVPSPSGTFIEISSDARDSCGVKTDGSATCWGSGHVAPFAPPEGGRHQVSHGRGGGFCDLRMDGTIACHGLNEFGETDAPAGTFVQVSAGDRFACSLRGDGTVECWGKNDVGQGTDPVGTFSQIDAGDSHACGVRTDGTLHCWGDDSLNKSSPPPGIFSQVSAGDMNSCALDADGGGLCWGSDIDGQSPSPLLVKLDSIAAGAVSTCGVRTNGKIQCWGRQGSVLPTLTFSRGEFSQTSSECGLRTDGSLDCWIPVWTPAGVFTQVDSSGYYCALRDDGYKVCW